MCRKCMWILLEYFHTDRYYAIYSYPFRSLQRNEGKGRHELCVGNVNATQAVWYRQRIGGDERQTLRRSDMGEIEIHMCDRINSKSDDGRFWWRRTRRTELVIAMQNKFEPRMTFSTKTKPPNSLEKFENPGCIDNVSPRRAFTCMHCILFAHINTLQPEARCCSPPEQLHTPYILSTHTYTHTYRHINTHTQTRTP